MGMEVTVLKGSTLCGKNVGCGAKRLVVVGPGGGCGRTLLTFSMFVCLFFFF